MGFNQENGNGSANLREVTEASISSITKQQLASFADTFVIRLQAARVRRQFKNMQQ